MARTRFGVIGLGTWGRAHLETYSSHPRAELRAICDLDQQRLRQAAAEYAVSAAYGDFRRMLALEELDAVSIATPDFAHTDAVIAAVSAGRAVLVEKPLATTLEDCDRVGEALRAHPVPFMVDFHNRWSPGVVSMHDAIAAGELGAVQTVTCRLNDTLFVPTRMLPWAGRSSVLYFLASHCLDTLRWVLGDEVARVYSTSSSRVLTGRGVDTPDFYLTTLEFRRGARALLENSWILPESSTTLVDFKLDVVGESGAFHFDGSPHQLVRVGPQRPEGVDTFIAPRVHGRTLGFATESIRHFVDCLAEGRTPMVGYEDGREVTRIILAIEESARTGRPVDLDY
jgi:predicted dehydrogenase